MDQFGLVHVTLMLLPIDYVQFKMKRSSLEDDDDEYDDDNPPTFHPNDNDEYAEEDESNDENDRDSDYDEEIRFKKKIETLQGTN